MLTETVSSMTRVYRVEDDAGRGPYRGQETPALDDRKTERHPMFTGDHYPYSHLRYGFKSVMQLVEWFDTKERDELRRKGFQLAVYEVREYTADRVQLIFNMAGALRIETRPLPK